VATSVLQIAAGETIFREGDPPGDAYLIESGKIEVSILQNQRPVVLSFLGAGELLGEMAVIDDAPRSATALALEPTRLTRIDREQINLRLSEADPIISLLMQKMLARYRDGLQAARGRSAATKAAQTAPSVVKMDKAIEKFRLESQLMSALQADELSAVFQPIYDVRAQAVVGFEALTRWQHPERGAISPAEFIALAEETNLILPVGQYALRKSCDALKMLPARFAHAFIAVNISARQGAEPHFAELIASEAERAGIELSRLELEITESLTLDYKSVRSLIERCHGYGIRVSLDDFGTGFSNLGHLHELAFDHVKLDQAFTRQMIGNRRCLELVRGIVNMVHAIGADVVAEGVESAEQAAALREMGVRYLQGWFVGKPSAADQLQPFLERGALAF
jgi:diguanylate cyclase